MQRIVDWLIVLGITVLIVFITPFFCLWCLIKGDLHPLHTYALLLDDISQSDTSDDCNQMKD